MIPLVNTYKPFVIIVFLLLAQNLFAQNGEIEALERNGLKELFQSTLYLDPEIDSLKLTYYDYRINYLDTYSREYVLDNTSKMMMTIFDLNYEGDLLLLQTKYPRIYEGVMSPKLLQENWKHTKKGLDVTVTQQSVRLSNPSGLLVATAKPAKIKALAEYLTKNYNATITPPVDSILIVQAIVEKETGALGQKEILRGEKGPFYDFVFGKDPKHEKYMIYQGFFKPKIMSGRVWRSFADIYIRLNSDGTFTVSTTAVGRKFMIKDYKDDSDNPIFRLYD